MKKKKIDHKFQELFFGQLKLICVLVLSIAISYIFVILFYIVNYRGNFLYLETFGFFESIILSFIIFYPLFNIVTLIKYLRLIKYNLYFILFSISFFMLIPVQPLEYITSWSGNYFARDITGIYRTDAVDLFGIMGFFLFFIIEFIMAVLIAGVIFKKFLWKNKK